MSKITKEDYERILFEPQFSIAGVQRALQSIGFDPFSSALVLTMMSYNEQTKQSVSDEEFEKYCKLSEAVGLSMEKEDVEKRLGRPLNDRVPNAEVVDQFLKSVLGKGGKTNDEGEK